MAFNLQKGHYCAAITIAAHIPFHALLTLTYTFQIIFSFIKQKLCFIFYIY